MRGSSRGVPLASNFSSLAASRWNCPSLLESIVWSEWRPIWRDYKDVQSHPGFGARVAWFEARSFCCCCCCWRNVKFFLWNDTKKRWMKMNNFAKDSCGNLVLLFFCVVDFANSQNEEYRFSIERIRFVWLSTQSGSSSKLPFWAQTNKQWIIHWTTTVCCQRTLSKKMRFEYSTKRFLFVGIFCLTLGALLLRRKLFKKPVFCCVCVCFGWLVRLCKPIYQIFQ